MYETELILDQVDFPPFSARNCQQSLAPIESGQLKRTINGDLIYLTIPGQQKFRSTIKCQDKTIPAFNNLWRGSLVNVSCIQQLSQELKISQDINLIRPAVKNSIIFTDGMQEFKKNFLLEGKRVRILEEIQSNKNKIYIFYRPLLKMCVLNFQILTNEWDISTGWQLDLEEI